MSRPTIAPGSASGSRRERLTELSILAAARQCPDRDCLVADEGGVHAYREMAERTSAAIAELSRRGVRAGARVALTPGLDVDSVIWLYALFELGSPVVLLHGRLPQPQVDQQMAGAAVLHRIRGSASALGRVAARPSPGLSPSAGDCLCVAHTSGTRGSPRAVVLSRRAFLASEAAHAANLGWRADDRWLMCIPPAHIGGLSILTRSLIARRCVVLGPDPSGRFEAPQVIASLREHRVTLLSVVPTMLRRLLCSEEPYWRPPPTLRAVLVGGAPLSDALRRQTRDRGVPIRATYGCTEACSQVATQDEEHAGAQGVGRPLPGIAVRIRDGEIQLAGDVLMDGYLDDDDRSSTWTADGWYRTGDRGAFLPDGQLLVRGRRDEVIITGGENVSPEMVEAFLESVPGVRGSCVFGTPSEEWGQELAVAMEVEAEFSMRRFRESIDGGLAPHQRPRRFALVESLPTTSSGKLDRAAASRRFKKRLARI